SQELLDAFDLINLIFITIALVVTWPLAIFVYSKLLLCKPYSTNYTFTLIVLNGVSELFGCTTFLVNFQIATFPFARPLIVLLSNKDIGYPMKALDYLANGIGLHTAFFVALNRCKSIISLRRKGTDSTFFFASTTISLLFASLKIIDLYAFSNHYYNETDFGSGPIFIPMIEVFDKTLRTITDIETAVVSCCTFILNVVLAVFLARRRIPDDRCTSENIDCRFKGERGLIITSVVSYTFYTFYFVNSFIARYYDITFCGYAQFLFLGLASLTPFWCLIIFASSIRR
ncbi:hypothetical protein PMAYCL1PPCAC_14867, partial [Pristionchus mayeri]